MNQLWQFKSNSRPLSRWTALAASVLVALIVCSLARSSLAVQTNAGASREAGTTIARAKSRITVDGLLNELDWLDTVPVGDILQRDPHPGEKATKKTELKLLYDDENLYIGVACYDSELNRIIGSRASASRAVNKYGASTFRAPSSASSKKIDGHRRSWI